MTLSEGDAPMQAATTRQETPEDAKRAPYGLDDLMALEVTTGAVSPAMAKHMRASMHFERQRPISERNVDRLAEEMRRGWFLAGTPIFICVLPDGRQQIVNGNHTLEAVAESGVTIPLVIIRKRVCSMDEAAAAYAVMDIQKTRTWGDTLRAVGYSEEIPMAAHVNAAISIIISGFQDSTAGREAAASRHYRLQIIPEYSKAAQLIANCFDGAPMGSAKLIKRAPIFAVALYTARFQPAAAEEFWRGALMDDGLGKNDPRKALLRYSTNNAVTGTKGRNDAARAAIQAWNAWFDGRTLEYCRPNAAGSIRILGTPMHKGAAE